MLQAHTSLPSRPMALMLVEAFPPAFARGGPAVSAANLIAATRDIIDWRVITRNDDAGNTQPIAEEGVWLGEDPRILRTNSYWRMGQAIHRALRRWPIRAILANSLFAPSTRTACVACLGARPLTFVVLPRGELDPGALQLKSVRKAGFVGVLKALHAESRIICGTTSELEKTHVRRIFPRARVVSIPNLPTDPANVTCRLVPPQGPTRLVFNSRVSEKKGLHVAIQALLTHRRPIHLDIFGSDSSAYAMRCRALAALAPQHVTIGWRGLVPPNQLHAALRDYHAMILPTMGENFGHAIAESLAAGTPVFLPDTTPWTQAVCGGAGLLLESGLPAAVTTALQRFEAMTPVAHATMRQTARAAALAVHGNSDAVAQVRASMEWLVQSPAVEGRQVCAE